MKILTEREAGIFLRKNKFDVARRAYVERTPKGVHQGGASSSSSPRNISEEMFTRGKFCSDKCKEIYIKINLEGNRI